MFSCCLFILFNAITCVKKFDPFDINNSEQKEYYERLNKSNEKFQDAEEALLESLKKDLARFDSETSNPNNIDVFTEDFQKTTEDIEKQCMSNFDMNMKSHRELLQKYDETKVKNIDVDAFIKESFELIDRSFERTMKNFQLFKEKHKKLAEKINKNEFISSETKSHAQAMEKLNEEHIANVTELNKLWKTGIKKAIKKHFSKTKLILIIVGSIIGGIALISLIVYFAVKYWKRSIVVE